MVYLLYYYTRHPVSIRVHMAVRTDATHLDAASILRDPYLRRGSRGVVLSGVLAVPLSDAPAKVLLEAAGLVIRSASEHARLAQEANPGLGSHSRAYARRRLRVLRGSIVFKE